MTDVVDVLTDLDLRGNALLNVAVADDPTSVPNMGQVEAAIQAAVSNSGSPRAGDGLTLSVVLGEKVYEVAAGDGIVLRNGMVSVSRAWLLTQIASLVAGTGVIRVLPTDDGVTLLLDQAFLYQLEELKGLVHPPVAPADTTMLIGGDQSIAVHVDPAPDNALVSRATGLFVPAKYTRSFVRTINLTGTGTMHPVRHNLGTQNLVVNLWRGQSLDHRSQVCIVDNNLIEIDGDAGIVKVVILPC